MSPEKQNRTNGKGAQDNELAELNQLKHLLREAMPPVASHELESRADLWPHLRARIESQQQANRAPATTSTHVHWFDWALAALATAALAFFPGIIPALLYHF